MPFKKQIADDSMSGMNFRKSEYSHIIADVNTPPSIRYRCTLLLHRLCSTGTEKEFYEKVILGEYNMRPAKVLLEGIPTPPEEPKPLDVAVEQMAKWGKDGTV